MPNPPAVSVWLGISELVAQNSNPLDVWLAASVAKVKNNSQNSLRITFLIPMAYCKLNGPML